MAGIWKWIVGEVSFQIIAIVLRLWGRRLISTERARIWNTALVALTIRVLSGRVPEAPDTDACG